jgi:hypothetical protein
VAKAAAALAEFEGGVWTLGGGSGLQFNNPNAEIILIENGLSLGSKAKTRQVCGTAQLNHGFTIEEGKNYYFEVSIVDGGWTRFDYHLLLASFGFCFVFFFYGSKLIRISGVICGHAAILVLDYARPISMAKSCPVCSQIHTATMATTAKSLAATSKNLLPVGLHSPRETLLAVVSFVVSCFSRGMAYWCRAIGLRR